MVLAEWRLDNFMLVTNQINKHKRMQISRSYKVRQILKELELIPKNFT